MGNAAQALVETMQNDILERVITIVAESQRISPAIIKPTSLLQSLGIDSLGGLSVIFDLEEEFGITVPMERLDSGTTIGDLADGVRELIAEQAAGTHSSAR